MNISISSNISPYQSLAKYMASIDDRQKIYYSSEIDGILDEDGNGSIDAPDGANSEKEWEYFCSHADQFSKTVKIFESFMIGNYYMQQYADPDVLIGLVKYNLSLFMSCHDIGAKDTYAHRIGQTIYFFADRTDISGDKIGEMLLALMPSLELDEFAGAMPYLDLNSGLSSLYMHKTVNRSIRNEFIVKLAGAADPGKRGQFKSARMIGFFSKNTLQLNYTNGLTIKIRDLACVWDTNDLFLIMTKKLPRGFFSGLLDLSVEFKDDSHYYPSDKRICLGTSILDSQEKTISPGFCSDIHDSQNVLTHELAHYWSMNHNLSCIYYGISWDNKVFLPDHLRILRTDDQHDFVEDYGMKNPLEDIATFAGSYVAISEELRRYVREQMDIGNFEPAAKYLFIRYVMPFKGMEYEVSDSSPTLGFEEVRSKLAAYLFDHPSRVAKTTIDAINRIEREYNTNTENL
jgi:hypothetical protein